MGCGSSSDGPLFENTLILEVPSGWAGVNEDAIIDWVLVFMMSPDMLDITTRAAQMEGATVTELQVSAVRGGGVVCHFSATQPGKMVPQKVSQLHEFSRVGNSVTVTMYHVQPGIFQEYTHEPEAIKKNAFCSIVTVYRATMNPDGKVAVTVTASPIRVLSKMPGVGMILALFKPLMRRSFERAMKATQATFAQQQSMPAPIDVNGKVVLPVARADLPVVQGVCVSPVPDAQVVDAKVVIIDADN
mmetsp:Transcript_47662/g.94732  ORF Transcript_47662/g.94732 Transcript_47662/m.94732 type:complete len:245 (+) Transcript_47662:16-750(+)